MTIENKNMKEWLLQNGINCTPKYIKEGSMKGTWRLDDSKIINGQLIASKWWGNKELQNKLTELGFLNFEGEPLNDYCGNGGIFSVFLILNDKFMEWGILHNEEVMMV